MNGFGRIRQVISTIISKETIKPSSPTPPHLKTHMLSLLDHIAPNIHMPSLYFYQNFNNGDIEILKKSLSQSLTHYYTFAGRRPTSFSPHIECNDEGVVFLEASSDSRLHDYINLQAEQDEIIDLLIPNALGCAANKTSPNMMEVQLTHFGCGGAALAVSISHKAADAFTIFNFMNHWANVACGRTPKVVSFSSYMGDMKILERLAAVLQPKTEVTYATRKFVFPNLKLNELKSKINAMGTTPINPSRLESLSALIFKCAVDAAATKSTSFQPSSLTLVVNLRNRVGKIIDKSAAGNIVTGATAKMADPSQIKLGNVITSIRKGIMEFTGLKDTEELDKKIENTMLTFVNTQCRNYVITSICRFPYYQLDFGWGKPVRVIVRSGDPFANLVVLMDTPGADGIEAIVHLDEEEMTIFQKDKELLAYVEDVGTSRVTRASRL